MHFESSNLKLYVKMLSVLLLYVYQFYIQESTFSVQYGLNDHNFYQDISLWHLIAAKN